MQNEKCGRKNPDQFGFVGLRVARRGIMLAGMYIVERCIVKISSIGQIRLVQVETIPVYEDGIPVLFKVMLDFGERYPTDKSHMVAVAPTDDCTAIGRC